MSQHVSKDVLIDVLSDVLSDPVSIDELTQAINNKADVANIEALETSLGALQTAVNSKVNKSGDTITGALTFDHGENAAETCITLQKSLNNGTNNQLNFGVKNNGIGWLSTKNAGQEVNFLVLAPKYTSLKNPLNVHSGGTGVSDLTGFVSDSMLSTDIKNKIATSARVQGKSWAKTVTYNTVIGTFYLFMFRYRLYLISTTGSPSVLGIYNPIDGTLIEDITAGSSETVSLSGITTTVTYSPNMTSFTVSSNTDFTSYLIGSLTVM